MKPFFAFQWHITDECDQRCKHCYIFAANKNKTLSSMSFAELKKTLAACLKMCETFARRPYFYITGGDPVLHENFWQLLDLLHSQKIPFTVMGNPFHLDDSVCRKLKERGCEKYQMSLDGTRETHDWFRKPGSFDCTLEKIACLKRASIRAVIMSTVSGKNIGEIPAVIDIVAAAGVDVYAFARHCPTDGEKDNGISPEAYRNLLDICHQKFTEYEKNGCETWFNRKDHLWTLYDYENGFFKIPAGAEKNMIYDGCNCGNSHLTILPDGDVYACRRVPNSKIGNVFRDELAALWLNEMERYRDYDKFAKCAKCELLAWCRGCPAAAASTAGDFYAADPQCWKNTEEK